MKKFLINFFLFLAFAFFLYCAGIAFLGEFGNDKFKKNLIYKRAGPGHTYSRLHDAEKVNDVDVLFFGTSLSFRGYDTRILKSHDIRAFNLGTAGETPIQTEFLIKRYLDKINPRLVVYEINPEWFTLEGVESGFDIISNLPTVDWGALKLAFRMNDVKVYNNLIYSFLKSDIYGDNDFKEPLEKNGEIYIPGGGYVESPLISYSPSEIEPKKLDLRMDQISAFNRSLSYIEDLAINYVLIWPPVSDELYYSLNNRNEIERFFKERGTFKNYNQSLPLVDSLHFSDSRHLNQEGVKIFNEAVVKFLRENIK